MKKHFILLFATALFTVNTFAQTKPLNGKLNLAIEGALPLGDAADAFDFGMGVSAKFESPLSSTVNFTANVGLTSFMVKDAVKKISLDKSSSRLYIPVEAGIKYFFAPTFYGEGQVGAALSTKNGVVTKYAYTPGIGLIFPASNGSAIDLGVRYEGWVDNGDSTLGFIGLRLAYKFSL
jgi:hypothetical protein